LIEYAKDADLAIHECFVAVPDLVKKMGFTPESALVVGTQIHTAPEAFGKVMSMIEPRHAVAYHFFKDFDTTAEVNDRIRTTYDGPLSLAEDFMVWNITKDDIRVRMAVVEEHTWAPPLVNKPELPQKVTEINTARKWAFRMMRWVTPTSSRKADGVMSTRCSAGSTKRQAKNSDKTFLTLQTSKISKLRRPRHSRLSELFE
jgi:hypothetical protein